MWLIEIRFSTFEKTTVKPLELSFNFLQNGEYHQTAQRNDTAFALPESPPTPRARE
jgi:hypothetical protein